MVFSSPIFLFIFLPSVWILHALLPERFRKVFLLFASLMFYMYGEGSFVVLMLATITIAYISIKLIQNYENHRKAVALIGSVLAILILLVFKYANLSLTTSWKPGIILSHSVIIGQIPAATLTFVKHSAFVDVEQLSSKQF